MTRTCLNPSGNPRMPGNLEIDNRTRLDKWLWAARFFKTRALASQAVNGGKVHLDGQRVKSSRQVRIDDCYEILRGQDRLEVIVRELGEPLRGGEVEAAVPLEAPPQFPVHPVEQLGVVAEHERLGSALFSWDSIRESPELRDALAAAASRD